MCVCESVCVSVCVCVCVCVCVGGCGCGWVGGLVWVCVRKRGGNRDRQIKRQRDRENMGTASFFVN